MSQRVNISYSVELENLDVEVQRLLKNALVCIQRLVNECNEIDQEVPLTLQVSQKIDDVRQQMALADVIFSDVSNIINGYLQYKTAPEKNSHEPPFDEQPSNDVDNFSQLKEKIEKFKEAIDNANVSDEDAD